MQQLNNRSLLGQQQRQQQALSPSLGSYISPSHSSSAVGGPQSSTSVSSASTSTTATNNTNQMSSNPDPNPNPNPNPQPHSNTGGGPPTHPNSLLGRISRAKEAVNKGRIGSISPRIGTKRTSTSSSSLPVNTTTTTHSNGNGGGVNVHHVSHLTNTATASSVSSSLSSTTHTNSYAAAAAQAVVEVLKSKNNNHNNTNKNNINTNNSSAMMNTSTTRATPSKMLFQGSHDQSDLMIGASGTTSTALHQHHRSSSSNNQGGTATQLSTNVPAPQQQQQQQQHTISSSQRRHQQTQIDKTNEIFDNDEYCGIEYEDDGEVVESAMWSQLLDKTATQQQVLNIKNQKNNGMTGRNENENKTIEMESANSTEGEKKGKKQGFGEYMRSSLTTTNPGTFFSGRPKTKKPHKDGGGGADCERNFENYDDGGLGLVDFSGGGGGSGSGSFDPDNAAVSPTFSDRSINPQRSADYENNDVGGGSSSYSPPSAIVGADQQQPTNPKLHISAIACDANTGAVAFGDRSGKLFLATAGEGVGAAEFFSGATGGRAELTALSAAGSPPPPPPILPDSQKNTHGNSNNTDEQQDRSSGTWRAPLPRRNRANQINKKNETEPANNPTDATDDTSPNSSPHDRASSSHSSPYLRPLLGGQEAYPPFIDPLLAEEVSQGITKIAFLPQSGPTSLRLLTVNEKIPKLWRVGLEPRFVPRFSAVDKLGQKSVGPLTERPARSQTQPSRPTPRDPDGGGFKGGELLSTPTNNCGKKRTTVYLEGRRKWDIDQQCETAAAEEQHSSSETLMTANNNTKGYYDATYEESGSAMKKIDDEYTNEEEKNEQNKKKMNQLTASSPLSSPSSNKTLSAATATCMATFNIDHSSEIHSICPTADGAHFYTCDSLSIRYWSVDNPHLSLEIASFDSNSKQFSEFNNNYHLHGGHNGAGGGANGGGPMTSPTGGGSGGGGGGGDDENFTACELFHGINPHYLFCCTSAGYIRTLDLRCGLSLALDTNPSLNNTGGGGGGAAAAFGGVDINGGSSSSKRGVAFTLVNPRRGTDGIYAALSASIGGCDLSPCGNYVIGRDFLGTILWDIRMTGSSQSQSMASLNTGSSGGFTGGKNSGGGYDDELLFSPMIGEVPSVPPRSALRSVVSRWTLSPQLRSQWEYLYQNGFLFERYGVSFISTSSSHSSISSSSSYGGGSGSGLRSGSGPGPSGSGLRWVTGLFDGRVAIGDCFPSSLTSSSNRSRPDPDHHSGGNNYGDEDEDEDARVTIDSLIAEAREVPQQPLYEDPYNPDPEIAARNRRMRGSTNPTYRSTVRYLRLPRLSSTLDVRSRRWRERGSEEAAEAEAADTNNTAAADTAGTCSGNSQKKKAEELYVHDDFRGGGSSYGSGYGDNRDSNSRQQYQQSASPFVVENAGDVDGSLRVRLVTGSGWQKKIAAVADKQAANASTAAPEREAGVLAVTEDGVHLLGL